ncbi:unnamed protein product, partial [Cyprideis torosa]
PLTPQRIAADDVVIVSGDIGRHGLAVMTARHQLEIDSPIQSDVACLHGAMQAMIDAGIDLHCARDLTRGGLATTLLELADAADQSIQIDEAAIPLLPEAQSLCRLLGFDPLYLANEGAMAVFVAADEAERCVEVLNANGCPRAAAVGRVAAGEGVELLTPYGSRRRLHWQRGEQLPRIC